MIDLPFVRKVFAKVDSVDKNATLANVIATHPSPSSPTKCIRATLGMGSGGVSMKRRHDVNICKNIKWYLFKEKNNNSSKKCVKLQPTMPRMLTTGMEMEMKIKLYLNSNLQIHLSLFLRRTHTYSNCHQHEKKYRFRSIYAQNKHFFAPILEFDALFVFLSLFRFSNEAKQFLCNHCIIYDSLFCHQLEKRVWCEYFDAVHR